MRELVWAPARSPRSLQERNRWNKVGVVAWHKVAIIGINEGEFVYGIKLEIEGGDRVEVEGHTVAGLAGKMEVVSKHNVGLKGKQKGVFQEE